MAQPQLPDPTIATRFFAMREVMYAALRPAARALRLVVLLFHQTWCVPRSPVGRGKENENIKKYERFPVQRFISWYVNIERNNYRE